MEKTEITTEGSATYCPEDDKIRLYVGRVPRDEYDRLRAEGWTATPKQSCDFVAVWTPARRDTALEFAGIIEDEDQGPEDRAADRAERFGGYRDKRTGEAVAAADRYDNGPQAHGYQSERRAARAAFRHDRIAGRACDAWSKAEYWQQRTAGVISHALHNSTPAVRMGRIKEIESQLRRNLSDDWRAHYELRLAYENQMIAAQGGRAAFVEMEVGGWIGRHQIRKINKSPATGRVVSVTLKQPGTRWNGNAPGFCLIPYNIERLPTDAYRAPSAEDLAALADVKKAEKAAAPVKAPCPLVNPTDAEAERLQALWNAEDLAGMSSQYNRDNFKPSTVRRITQATYSANSKGSYAHAETCLVYAGGSRKQLGYSNRKNDGRAEVCQVRTTYGNGNASCTRSVIILIDKPQNAFPANVWPVEAAAQPVTVGEQMALI